MNKIDIDDIKVYTDKYKVITSISLLTIEAKKFDIAEKQFYILKDLCEDVIAFIIEKYPYSKSQVVDFFDSEQFPNDLRNLETIVLYKKILALKYACIESDDLDLLLKFNNMSIELNPKEKLPYLNIANVLYQQKKYNDAIEICERINSTEKTIPAIELLGKIYRDLKEYDKSIENYKLYTELNENDEDTVVILNEIYKEALSYATWDDNKKADKEYFIAMTLLYQNLLPQAFFKFAQLLDSESNNIKYIKGAAIALVKLKAYSVVKDLFLADLEKFSSDPEVMSIIGAVYFGMPQYYQNAIPIYQNLVKSSPQNADAFYRLAFLFERVYQDKFLEKQIEYAKNALEFGYDKNTVLVLLAKLYYRYGDKVNCQKCFDELLKNNPIPEEKVIYGRFLMKEGQIKEGYDWYRFRFDAKHFSYPKVLNKESRCNKLSELFDKTVIVHYEQGFGDSVMFSRYIPKIAEIANKVVFVVQKNLVPLFKASGFDKYCEILSHEADINPYIELEDTNKSVMYGAGTGMSQIPHDIHIPLMDTPFLFNENARNIYASEGYLSIGKNKIEDFKEKYINKNNKIKIGIAYHGTKESILTYRDISIKKFIPLLKMKNIEFYSFQSDIYAKELMELDKNIKIFDFGKVFKNFEDTACAMKCMDLIISTDNVVMNLAGALGIKTYALFNVFTESRWFKTTGDDIGWYKSVKPFQAKTFNDWDNVIIDVKNALQKEFFDK